MLYAGGKKKQTWPTANFQLCWQVSCCDVRKGRS